MGIGGKELFMGKIRWKTPPTVLEGIKDYLPVAPASLPCRLAEILLKTLTDSAEDSHICSGVSRCWAVRAVVCHLQNLTTFALGVDY